MKEYQKRNRELIKKRRREYYINNREEIALKNKQYYLKNQHSICKKKRKPEGRYTAYKTTAKKRGYSFELTLEEFLGFENLPCFYCGKSFEQIGIDRKDNNKGYSISNCVSCCFRCNEMKMSSSMENWFQHMLDILQHHEKI